MDAVPGPDRAAREEPQLLDLLDRAFEAAIAEYREEREPLAILFSGGVDSGILAWELRQRPSTVLSTIGLPGSRDLAAAGPAARTVGLPWVPAVLSDEDLAGTLERFGGELEGLTLSRRGIFLGLAAAIERAPANSLVCGQGADELFLGYAHFRNLTPASAGAAAEADLDRLLSDDWPRTVRIAAQVGRKIRAPYLHPSFVRAAREIPVDARRPNAVPKGILRAWGRRRGVPSDIIDRPKRALQFGSGIDAWLRRRGPR